ncbi:MATE family efflux transporter [Sulfitobacter donghicola]|uniref:Multidrug-efflux transporter n=1 Tax=Sulfitobacter donghicola DSW-25 = KCTC 12864 = JCM 14565 TaxID=1300350 RepID=A0A073IK45_9RHOB|nr:MATE family efflux transporter [Sulfitobacter donghicola]KEJ89945.1 multidrug transporter MatE [Sulfitobacter donghicola DSW-25 = KCTC 12864 = JCM 14565]KIN66929.1 Multidrug resistance protein NorM [Sulfitobacter donghicola DSW-25 = KCTC 12864 = JCM 14565]
MSNVMTNKAHVRAIAVLGLPLIGGHLAQMAIGVTDTVMLGWYGVEALAAVTLASTYFFILFIFGSGFAWAVMPMVASFAAEEDETSIRRATRMGLWLSFGFALLALPLMIFSTPILRMMGQEEAVVTRGAEYLSVAGWGILPALFVMVLKSYLAALERTQVVLWITVLAAIVNGLVNYALIFGNWGAPELGVIGAAIASLCTQVVSLVGVLIYVCLALPEHNLFRRLWAADWDMLRRVFTLGWPISFTGLSETGLFGASAVMMGWLGTVPLAAHGIALQLTAIVFMIHLGLGNAGTVRAGNAFGRNDPDHLARGAIIVSVMSLVTALITVLLFFLVPEFFLGIFILPDDPARAQILAIGVGMLAMAGFFQLVDGSQAIALGVLRGVQDTRLPMVYAAFSYWCVGMPMSYLMGFVFGWGGVGIWAGLGFGLGVAAILLNLRFWGKVLPDIRQGRLTAKPAES